MLNVAGFGFFGAQKFAPGGQVKKKLTDFEGGSGGAAGGLDLENLAAADDDLGAFRRFRFPLAGGQGEAADAGDAGQSFSAEAHGGDDGEVLGLANFAGGVAFQREQRIVPAHSGAIVGDADEAPSARLNF